MEDEERFKRRVAWIAIFTIIGVMAVLARC